MSLLDLGPVVFVDPVRIAHEVIALQPRQGAFAAAAELPRHTTW